MTGEAKFSIRVGDIPCSYELEIDEKNFNKQVNRLRVFLKNNNEIIGGLASDISRQNQKLKTKPSQFRLPKWIKENNPEVSDAIALILYCVDEPLPTGLITEIMNREFRKIDLRNVSKHLTSKNSDLYGYTTYDEVTSSFGLNNYGRRWVEMELLTKKPGSKSPRLTKIKKMTTKEP